MEITYRGPRGRITRIGTQKVDVKPGDTIDLPAAVARSLVAAGGWERVEAEKPKPTKATKATDEADQGGPS